MDRTGNKLTGSKVKMIISSKDFFSNASIQLDLQLLINNLHHYWNNKRYCATVQMSLLAKNDLDWLN